MTEILVGLVLVAGAYYVHKVVGQKYALHVEQGTNVTATQHVQPQPNVVVTPMAQPIQIPRVSVVNHVMPSLR